MSLESGKKSAAEMRAAQRDMISKAESVQPTVAVMEPNWRAMIDSQKAQVKTMGEILEKLDTLTTEERFLAQLELQLQVLRTDGKDSREAMEQYRQTLMREAQNTTTAMQDTMKSLERQAGKMHAEFGNAISQEQERMKNSTHARKELKNPFAGILFCEKCGAGLKRNVPAKNQGTAPWYRCPTRGCGCRIIKCHTVEEAIRDATEDWLDEYIIQLNSEHKPKVDPIATALEAVQAQLAGLQQQQDNLCDYLEKGVYTIEMFTKRNAALSREIKKLQTSEADLMSKQESGSQASKAAMDLIPMTQHILDNYDVLSIAEKNRLWKLVLKKATVYRTPDGELSVHIYPKLPK